MHGETLQTLGIKISEVVTKRIDEMVALRRELHAHPEVAFQEHRTQSTVLKWLETLGIQASPMAGTGVVGIIEGKSPGNTVLVRADLDALPIDEQGDYSFRSVHKGVMHACGHDAHTAMLMVLASILKERGIDRGGVKLMFQPAEEGEGGARRMIEEGVLTDPKVDSALAFHVWTPYDVGTICCLSGPQAASVDGFQITITGSGTHAATPEKGVDPIAIACQVVTSTQVLLSRIVTPTEPAVLTFTQIQAGSAFNVIPETTEILGTIRTYNTSIRDKIVNGVSDLATSISASFGGSAEMRITLSHRPVVNDPEISRTARSAAAEVVGDARIIEAPPLMVGEDIGEVFAKVPGALVILGAGNAEIGADFPHHHPRFSIDERVLPIGVEMGLRAISKMLQ